VNKTEVSKTAKQNKTSAKKTPPVKDLSKEARIKREVTRLRGIFRDLDANKKKAVEPLIRNAAFTTVSLDELQAAINANGFTEEYKNGENQFGRKQSEEVKTHIAMTKNLTAIIKTLAELTPPERSKDSKLDTFLKGGE